MNPHFANLTVASKYVEGLPKMAEQYNVRIVIPITVSPDSTEINFTVVGEQNNVMRFVQKFVDDRLLESKAHMEAQREESKHDRPITNDDVTDVKILVNTGTVEDFISHM